MDQPNAPEKQTRSNPRRFLRFVVIVLVIAVAAGIIKHGRHYVFPKRFAVVKPGALYRSGYCEPGPLKRLIREHGIRTILALLTHQPDSSRQQKEEAVAKEQNVRIIRIGMPGDGCAKFDLIDQAADIIADPSHYPLLVHCWAGVNRTGIVYAAWRMKYCGWNDEQALAEAIDYGHSPARNPAMREHLKRYYQSRIVSTRPVEE